MTLDDLKGYLLRPQTLPKGSIDELAHLRESYPYSSALSFLYLVALAQHKDVRYASELKKLAPLLPDRGRLYRLVEMEDTSLGSEAQRQTVREGEDAFALIDDYLERARLQGEDLPTELFLNFEGDRDDYLGAEQDLGWAMDHTSREDEGRARSTQETIPKANVTSHESDRKPTSDTEAKDAEVEDGLFTETLAKIYIKQGKYDRALRIIRSISLQYPKKNLYFAEQIRFLELLITNENEDKK